MFGTCPDRLNVIWHQSYESHSSMCNILCYYTLRVKEINHCDPAFRSLSHCGPVLEKDEKKFFWIFTGKPATMCHLQQLGKEHIASFTVRTENALCKLTV